MPDNTDAAIAFFTAFHFACPISSWCFRDFAARRANRFVDGRFDCKELMITGDDFVGCTAIRIVFERDEVADQIEKASLLEHPANECFQFECCSWGIELAFDRAPDFEPFLVRSERADARFEPVGDHGDFVVVHQRRNLLLVGLDLIVSRGEPPVGVFRNL